MRTTTLPLLAATIVLGGTAYADGPGDDCKLAGAVFGTDPIGGTLLLKDSTGYIKNINVSPETRFVKVPIAGGEPVRSIAVGEVNSGDLVCVQGTGSDKSLTISVLPRADVHRAQHAFLLEWQQQSVYGTVSSVDVPGRALTVEPQPPSTDKNECRVSVPATARLRAALPGERRIGDSTSFRFEDLQIGEPVYVRGTRPKAGQEIAASLILRGGYRGILGTLVKVQVLDSILQIQEFGTGRSLRMKIAPGELYRTTEDLKHPMRVQTQSGVTLVPVGFADLQTGDAVLIVGKTIDDNEDGVGLIAVTKFGTFGVLPQDPQKRIAWFLAK